MENLIWSLLVTVICLALLVWLATKLGVYVFSQWRPSGEIAVGTFTAVGLEQSTAEKAGTALSSRLDRLKRYSRSGTGSIGLVKTPEIISVPDLVKERQTLMKERLEGLDLKIKDLSVNQWVKAVGQVLEPAHPTLGGTVTDYGDSLEIKAQLRWKDRVLCAWVASGSKPTDKEGKVDDTMNDVTLNGLYDDLLFQILFDPPSTRLGCPATPTAAGEIENWQQLKAMTLGIESLSSYQRTLEHSDLKRARQYLERIPIHAPKYALGHYFYGVALSEDRQERLAASMFERTEALETNRPGSADRSKELLWNARLQRAASLIEEYDNRSAQRAVEILSGLVTDLRQEISHPGANAAFARRLLPFAQARLAYAYGTQFRLQVSVDEGLAEQAKAAWTGAREAFAEVEKDQWPSEQQRTEVLSWVLNAEGSARFRIAQWEFERGNGSEDAIARFKEESDRAREQIKQAIDYRPNNYLFLQNLAITLDDERLDSDGERLDEAEALYLRTEALVPQDYFQNERLARLYWRKARGAGAHSALWQALIEKGLENVRAVDRKRVGSPTPTAAVCGAYFLFATALIQTEEAEAADFALAGLEKADLSLRLKALASAQRAPIAQDAMILMSELSKFEKISANKELVSRLKKSMNDFASTAPRS